LTLWVELPDLAPEPSTLHRNAGADIARSASPHEVQGIGVFFQAVDVVNLDVGLRPAEGANVQAGGRALPRAVP
jgi:hypothetical protein